MPELPRGDLLGRKTKIRPIPPPEALLYTGEIADCPETMEVIAAIKRACRCTTEKAAEAINSLWDMGYMIGKETK